jgi:glucose-6-phosphate isomerase
MITQREYPGPLGAFARSTLDALARDEAIPRLFRRDAALWTAEPAASKSILNRLGWLDSPAWAKARIGELRTFSEVVRGRGVTRVLLLGMGGSSLAPEVFARVLEPAPGAPILDVLDSTVPSAVRAAEAHARLDRTFFLVSSKSGRTIETLSQYRTFRQRVEDAGLSDPAGRFAVITDPGSELDRLAEREGIRHVFRNPADIGGRYSALSYFGLLPAALLGAHLETLIGRAEAARAACADPLPEANPALRLGAFLGSAARSGRDKMTLLTPSGLRPLGYWIEQLVAESTGKSGVGIVPVEGEPVGSTASYGGDRVFVVITSASEPSDHLAGFAQELRHAGQPVVEIELRDREDLAAAFYTWETATAVAGAVLGINPFDEPNVQESKDNTGRLLAAFEKEGSLPEDAPRMREEDVEVHASDALWERLTAGAPTHPSLEMVLGRFLALAQPADYLALLGYVERTATTEAAFARLRRLVRDALRIAVLQGYGPRYLHSIGQLYKGGPPTGLFLLFTGAGAGDVSIPRARYGFGDLRSAQALGDLASLESRGKPTLRLHLCGDPEAAYGTIARSVERALVALAAGA